MDLAFNWKAVSVLMTLFLSWSGALFWIIKWLLDRYQRHIDQRFEGLERRALEERRRWEATDRAILELRAELPQQYVQREDWIRFSGQIDSKLDRLHAQQAEIAQWLSREDGRRKGEHHARG
ncbi:hypothetical protein [Arhodomonas sp. AD133]|uniref:hypothetical protein n=1 Tax=Arhodomonas sp. AD133 TaxID=3415009 RepID=UPI003EBED540